MVGNDGDKEVVGTTVRHPQIEAYDTRYDTIRYDTMNCPLASLRSPWLALCHSIAMGYIVSLVHATMPLLHMCYTSCYTCATHYATHPTFPCPQMLRSPTWERQRRQRQRQGAESSEADIADPSEADSSEDEVWSAAPSCLLIYPATHTATHTAAHTAAHIITLCDRCRCVFAGRSLRKAAFSSCKRSGTIWWWPIKISMRSARSSVATC